MSFNFKIVSRSFRGAFRAVALIAFLSVAVETPLVFGGARLAQASTLLPIHGETISVDARHPRALSEVVIADIEVVQFRYSSGCSKSPETAEHGATLEIYFDRPEETDELAFEVRFGGVGERFEEEPAFPSRYYAADAETGALALRIVWGTRPVFEEGTLTIEVRTVSTPTVAGEWSEPFEIEIDDEVEDR